MPPLSARSNPSQALNRPLKRTFSSTLPASSWVVTKKMRKEPDTETRTPPPLPPVQSDTTLAIFVHSSLRSSVQNDRFGDAERLACLGQKVLHMVITETLFEKRPMLGAVELIVSVPCTVHIVLILILLVHRPKWTTRYRRSLMNNGYPITSSETRWLVLLTFARS